MQYLAKLRRRFQKKFFPTDWDKVIRQWKSDKGDQTLRLDYDLNRNSTVLDLGGFRGEWAHQIHSRYGCKVHVFEPVTSFAKGIVDRFDGNTAIEVHSCGLGGITRSECIFLSADASSIVQKQGAAESIRIVDVVEWFEQHRIERVDLMKVNIEGAEYELLERMLDAGLERLINNIQVQFHNFTPNAVSRMKAILDRLQESHQPTYQYHFVWENWQRRVA